MLRNLFYKNASGCNGLQACIYNFMHIKLTLPSSLILLWGGGGGRVELGD